MDINRNLLMIKKSGGSYDAILNKIHQLKQHFTNILVDVRTKKENLNSFKDEKMKRV